MRYFSRSRIAHCYPIFDCNCSMVAYIESKLLWMFFQQQIDKAAEIIHVEKLQFHASIARQIKRSPLPGALKYKGLPVNIIHWPIKIRRAQNIGVGNPGPQRFFGRDLVRAIFSPESIWGIDGLLCEGLNRSFRVYRTGTDEDIILKAAHCIQKVIYIVRIVGCDIQNYIKKVFPQQIT